MLAVNLNRLPERIGHPTNLEVAEYSQRVMTDEVQNVEVDEMNRPILASHCHAVRIDRAILLLIADVTEYRQTIVTEIARTTIVVIEIAVDGTIIDAIDQDGDKSRRLIQTMAMEVASPVMIAHG